ncbi:hypothetical protein KAU11_06670 [Candidatus Babeliales bacterium]|nr:hypothetical protein [Candidatus Babeliales bacterium]
MKRYTITIDMYVHALDDTDIRNEAKKLIELLKKEVDNPEILTIHDTPFGTIGDAREVHINSECCDAPILENTDLCSDCKEHTGRDK